MEGEYNNTDLGPPGRRSRSKTISVLIVDDQPIVRFGIRQLLAAESGIEVAAETDHWATAWAAINSLSPRVLLMDVDLRDGCAHKLILKITEAGLATRILVYSAQAHDWQVVEALRSGAHGYITKDVEPLRLCEAIRAINNNGSYLDPAIASKVIGQLGRKHERREQGSRNLTPREAAVLNGIAMGKRNQDIAADLYITERTVKYHLSSMFTKLQVRNRTEAVKFAFDHGLIR